MSVGIVNFLNSYGSPLQDNFIVTSWTQEIIDTLPKARRPVSVRPQNGTSSFVISDGRIKTRPYGETIDNRRSGGSMIVLPSRNLNTKWSFYFKWRKPDGKSGTACSSSDNLQPQGGFTLQFFPVNTIFKFYEDLFPQDTDEWARDYSNGLGANTNAVLGWICNSWSSVNGAGGWQNLFRRSTPVYSTYSTISDYSFRAMPGTTGGLATNFYNNSFGVTQSTWIDYDPSTKIITFAWYPTSNSEVKPTLTNGTVYSYKSPTGSIVLNYQVELSFTASTIIQIGDVEFPDDQHIVFGSYNFKGGCLDDYLGEVSLTFLR